MINFRFHLVSLVAIFLALAVGIVMGSTVVKEGVVTSLRGQIRNVSDDIDQVRDQNDGLRLELADSQEELTALMPYAVAGQLEEQGIALLAERGADEDIVATLGATLDAAGADVPMIIWLEPRLNLPGQADAEALAAALDLTFGDSLRKQAYAALSERIVTGPPDGSRPDMLDALAEADFITIEPRGPNASDDPADLPSGGATQVVAVGAPATDDDAIELAEISTATTDVALETLAAEAWVPDPGAERGAALADILDDPELRDLVSTVESIDRVDGRVATVLALDRLREDEVGHYGVGAGADVAVPPPGEP